MSNLGNQAFCGILLPTSPALAVNGICTSTPGAYYSYCLASGWTGGYQIGNGATIGIYGSSFGVPQPDPDGSNALIIQSFETATESISIPVSGIYSLTFYAANRSNIDNGPQTLAVLWDNAAVTGGTYSHLGAGWALETLNFHATAGAGTLTFSGLDPSRSDVTAFVDDVKLEPATATPTPEPSSVSLVALTLIGAATLMRMARRRLAL